MFFLHDLKSFRCVIDTHEPKSISNTPKSVKLELIHLL